MSTDTFLGIKKISCTDESAEKTTASESALNDLLSCDFCGKDENNVRALVVHEKTGICSDCIMVCIDILKDDLDKAMTKLKTINNFER